MFIKKRLFVAVAAAIALGAGSVPAQAGSLSLDETPYPILTDDDASEGHDVLSTEFVKFKGKWKETGFTTLLRSGDELPLLVGTEPSDTKTIRYGTIFMEDGTPLIDEATNQPAISNSNDFNSLIQAGDHLFLVSHFETRPAVMYLTLLEQKENGELEAVATRPLDFAEVKGGWVHCAGTVTPWGTHMGSEEYEPDARQWVDPKLEVGTYEAAMHGYFDADGWVFNNNNPDGDPEKAKELLNPYWYGYPVEVAVGEDGSDTITKHYAIGRSANELSIVMPDQKTVYITDDGTNTALLMFVAEDANGKDLEPGDLSQGTLYAGIWNQVADTPEGGKANLTWVNLGHATADQIKQAAFDPDVTFDELFDYEAVSEPDEGICPTLNSINSGHGSPYHECLAIKDGVDETVVSRLETRRYAALKGATTEFRKMEGASYDPAGRKLYMAMSDIGSGMKDGDATRDLGGPNHIRLTANKCGAIYELPLRNGVKDTGGERINSKYVATKMNGILAGTPQDVDENGNNGCSLDGIGNPDNISMLPRYGTLVIGEDAGNSVHQIDMVWAYNLREKELTRIQTTPYGSETTSVYWYPNLNNYGYLMSVIQHPYGESDEDRLADAPDGDDAKYGYVGYFKFPALKK
jgi:secreted PhoX family phosphatase